MIIERPRLVKRINEARKWVMVYGRRKTGKSFIVENFIKWDDYFFVKRDRTIISKKGNKIINRETFLELMSRGLNEERTIVVDEFHRLGNDFFDFLHSMKKSGRLILISSTLYLSKKLFDSRSPLLGFFAEVPVWSIDIEDSISALIKYHLDNKTLLEMGVILTEPIAIDYFEENKNPRSVFANIILNSAKTIPSLIGEIFAEEERSVSAVYEGILRAIANGDIVSGEITSYLFSRKLINKDDPSLIQQYLNNLVDFGVIKRIKVFGKNKFVYKHQSPLARIFYYSDEKYNISERNPTEEEIEAIVAEMMPKIIEDCVRELIARKRGLTESIVEASDYDVDAYLLKFKKPKIAVEVKWKKVNLKDLEKAETTLQKVEAEEKLLFIPDKKKFNYKTKLEITDILDFA